MLAENFELLEPKFLNTIHQKIQNQTQDAQIW